METHVEWVSRKLVRQTEWRVLDVVPLGHWNKRSVLEFPLPNTIWNELEQIPVEIGTGLSTDQDPEIIIMSRSFSESQCVTSVTHKWPIPASLCYSQNEDFSGNWTTSVFISPFRFKRPVTDWCVLFSTRDCWADVMFFFLPFIFFLGNTSYK